MNDTAYLFSGLEMSLGLASNPAFHQEMVCWDDHLALHPALHQESAVVSAVVSVSSVAKPVRPHQTFH